MVEEKKTTIIDFQIQEGDALSSLASTKKSILETKEAQKQLNEEYKKGAKDVDTYAKESVQLEASLKKQQAQYSTLQRTVTGLKSPFDKLNESIKDQAKQVRVAGLSLSDFATPATGTVAVLGALFKAYSSSTVGAKDLTFASNQLSSATSVLSNNLASLISGKEDGEGFFSILTSSIIAAVGGFGAATESFIAASRIEELEDLSRERLKVQAENNQLAAENLQIMEKLADSQVSFNEKQQLGVKAVTNIAISRDALLKVAERELEILNDQFKINEKDDKLKDAIRLKELEISGIRKDAEAATSRIDKTESNILDTKIKQGEVDQANLEKAKEKQIEADRRYFEEMNILQLEADIRKAEGRQAEIDAEQAKHDTMVEGMKAWLKNSEDLAKKRVAASTKAAKDETRIAALEQKARFDNSVAAFGALAGLFEQGTQAYKIATLTKLTLDTASAISSLTAASESNPLNGVTFGGAGTLQFITGLIRIFANIGQASQLISAAAGGGSFMTKGPQLLMVGDNPGGVERVDVTPVSGKGKTVVGKNMVAMAGGGTMFTDASTMANASMAPQSSQSISVALTYKEFKEFEDSIMYKERVATA